MTVVPPRLVTAHASSTAAAAPAISNGELNTAVQCVDDRRRTRRDRWRRRRRCAPSVRASSSFAGFVSTATMRPAPTATDPNSAVETDAPEPHHRHRRTGRHSRRVDHRTDTRDHRAAEDRGHLRRHVGIDPDHRAGHHDRPLGEGRDPAVVVQRPAADRKTPASRLKRPGCASRPRRLTQVGPAGGTEGVLATVRDEDHHHLVPDGKAIDVRSQCPPPRRPPRGR